jgi:four helix bundle protein
LVVVHPTARVTLADAGLPQLRVWRKAHAFAIAVRRLTRHFPRGFARLKEQLIAAAESIPGNIVEGCGAATPREFARFLDMSIKSSSETEYWLQLAHAHEIVPTIKWKAATLEVTDIRRTTYSLRKKVLASEASRSPKNQASLRESRPSRRPENR